MKYSDQNIFSGTICEQIAGQKKIYWPPARDMWFDSRSLNLPDSKRTLCPQYIKQMLSENLTKHFQVLRLKWGPFLFKCQKPSIDNRYQQFISDFLSASNSVICIQYDGKRQMSNYVGIKYDVIARFVGIKTLYPS